MKLNQYEWNPEKDKLGEGTFAEVFKAKDIHTNRYVALKIYKASVKGSTSGSTVQSKYSLEKEFQNVQAVSHTNIITYYGLNYIKHIDAMGREASHPVIIMEYANQGTLTEFLKIDPKKSILDKLVKDIIKGVGHLHEEGIIHRDLKPGNILVSKNKRGVYTAKITDFGISKDTLSSDDITKSHTELVGTPHYMAPEQIYQKRFGLDGRISSRTDLWAIGVMIYKVFTGKLPFANGVHDIELVHEAITKEEVDLIGVPKEYHKLLKQCFYKNAAHRVSNAGQMLKLIEEEGTTTVNEENNKDLDKTVVLPTEDDGGTIDINSLKGKGKDKDYEKAYKSLSKSQKIILAIFSIANLSWFGYFWFSEESAPYIYLLYPISIIMFCFFYLKPSNGWGIPKIFVYGFLMYCNIIFLMLISMTIFESNLEVKSILKIGLALVFQIGLSIWLLLVQIRKIWKGKTNNMDLTSYLLGTSLLVYLISYFLSIDNEYNGLSTFFLLSDSLMVLTLLPNVFFTTALLFFVFKKHKQNLWFLFFLFISSVLIASIWWLMVGYNNGYKIVLTNSYIQELRGGYYLWFLSIFSGFSVILYDAFKLTKTKKVFWPILGVLVLVLGIIFSANWSNSKNVYNFNRGLKNVDYNQFKKAFNSVKPLNVRSYDLKNFVKNILEKYNDGNAAEVKQMLELFVNSNGEVTYIEDENLETAIRKQDPELLKILLNPTGSTRFEDVDFVHEDKSLLKLAQEIGNKVIEKLLVDAGAKLTKAEKEAEAKAKLYSWEEDFTNGSNVFKESNNQDSQWSFGKLTRSYMLSIKNEKTFHQRSLDFNKILDRTKPYSVSVKIQRKKQDSDVGVGVLFDSNGKDYHISVIRNNTIFIFKRFNDKWTEIFKKTIAINSIINTVAVSKNGNYVSCSVNGNNIIQNLKIESFGGLNLGIICSNPIRKTTVFFDDFKVTGTKK